jgi:Tol biopolymer transport system component
MSLSTGTRLGPYEILAPIGAGGMGEVYRARDTKLDRDVAIKVLPPSFAQDPERLARFEREAKVLASLNHPNIAQIYGIEDRALVMELVPGESLKGPLPLETAVSYARQIADALEAAHEKNIIHRDLKPANIMITPQGVVKVLDFGLAAVAQSSDPSNPANSPTLTISPTRAGMILGTAGYMSPEQARGKAVEKRADIWAFGVVFFEIITGKPLFEGETVSDTLAAVLTKEPDWEQVPAQVRRLLKKCLEKDPKKRLRDIGDAWELLEEPAAPIPHGRGSVGSRHGTTGWIAAAILALALFAVGALFWRATRPVEQPLKPLVRLDVDLGADPPGSIGGGRGGWVILSPDGTRLVYGSKSRLFVRRLDQLDSTELPGTEASDLPFFSPDGQWIAFRTQGKLKKISVQGGAAITLCDAPSLFGGSWGEDGNIVASLANPGGLSRIASSGGAPTAVTEPVRGEGADLFPQILPGGKVVLFTSGAMGRAGAFRIEVVSLPDRRRKTLIQGGNYGRYLATSNGAGYVTYLNQGTLFAVPFDMRTLEIHGAPVPVLEHVAYFPQLGYAWFDVSRNGTLVYRSETGRSNVIQWLDAAGKTQPLLPKPGAYLRPRLSPDGQRLALELGDGTNDEIGIYDWQRDTMSRVTFGGAGYGLPVWSPDGRFIVLGTGTGMFWTRADGAGKPQTLTQSTNVQVPTSFSPDGKRLVFVNVNPQSGPDLWTLPIENDGTVLRPGKSEVFLATPFQELQAAFSPDGKWLAYYSDESGAFEVNVRAFPDKGSKWQISNSGGMYPVWSRNGRELFYRTQDNQIMVVNYTSKGDSFVADKPRVWSERRIANIGQFMNYDVAPDGKRIAAIMAAETPEAQTTQSHVIFLMNFFDELRRRVPVDKK